ncbi:MAG TPA: hypothetical protein DDZ89_14075, partial [Clostridiales bacterium]|nr:hypothetical protein [Clostridiales bacterium]
NSDNHAGMGDSITFTATFNEQLKINGNCYSTSQFWGMNATLNVLDATGNPVSVRAASMAQVSGGRDLQNGASKGMVTQITFAPFIVAAGMSCQDPDGKIKITSITPYDSSVMITDLCGNGYQDSNNPWDSLNTNAYILDVTPPVVSVNLTPLSDGSYTPISMTSSGTNITSFCLPIQISDSSSVDGLTGSFSWVNQESGGTNYSYQYAVLASSNAPLETDWKNGTTGMNHSFTQVSAGTYIHIRLLPDTKYDLTSTSVVVSARDYPGNSNKASFVLNYTADGIPPAASLTGTSRDALAGKLTATIQVTDKVGIASVEYLWVTDSSVPTAETLGWSNCIGSFNNADKITTVSAERTGITVSAPFTGELYIKAVDTAGNVSVSNIGTLSYDISAPDYSITYPQEISAGASLSVSGLEENSALVVLVEKPDSPGTYYASVIDSMDQYGDVMENRSYLLNPSCNDLYKWRKYTVSESNGVYSFTYLGGSDDYLIRIINDLYYGKLRITVLSGTAIVKTSSYTNEPGNRENGAFVYTTTGGGLTYLATAGTASYPVYAENITLNVAPGNVLYAAPDVTTGYPGYYSDNLYTSVYQADITSDVILDKRITVNNQYNPIWDIPFNPDDPADDVLSTLEGVKITVNITNSIVKEWGVSDIDFKNSYLSIRLNSGQQIGELIPLSPMANQTITLPAYDYPSGSYNIILTFTSRASGAVSYFHYGKPIFVDATSASSDFGFAGVLNQSGSSRHGINEDQYIYYGPIYGAVDAEGKPYTQYSAGSETIYIPVNSTFGSIESTIAYNRLFFTVDDVSITNLGGFYGEKAIKAWNATVGVPDSSKVLSSWLNAYDATENGSSRYSLYSAVFVDSADQVEGAYKPRSLPLIKNTLNTIAFQVMNANGIASEVRTVYIYPVDVPVSGNITLTDTREFIKEGVLTFTPNPGQSMVNVSVLVHDYMTGETFDITHTYDMNSNTYTHILDKGGAHLYNLYTVDGMNNKTIFVERFWGLTDSGKPEIKSAVADVLDGATYMATISFHENTVFNKKDQILNLHFDSAYMAALGLNHSVNADTGSYTGDRFELNLPMGNAYYLQTIWLASESNPYGIYRVDVERRDHDGTVVLYGVRKFDTTVPEGTMLNHTLTATFTDPFGYISDPVNITMNVPNTKPAYTNGEYKEYSSGGGSTSYRGLVATFNTPVMVGKSIGTNSPTPYSTVKVSELPVFGDGSHLISFFDIFGTKWDQEINLVDEFGEYSLTIHLSESDYTKEAVTITITADHPNAASFTVYDSTDGGWTGLTGIFPKNFVSFTLSRNSQMNIIMRTNNDPSRVDRMLYLVNILPEAPSATLNWYFEEFKSNTLPAGVTQTTGKVTVGYKTSRKVTPSDGTASVYTFSHADPATSYTFRYTDEAGNAGYITADLNSLGLTLKAPDVPVPDTVKPEYQINLYGLYDGISKPVGYYSSVSTTESLDSILSAAGFVQSYYFDIEVTEDSPYKIVLLEGATADSSGVTYDQTSQSIPGVTLRGRTITAANAVSFTAVIVDNAGNRNSFSMNLGEYLDNTAPTATIEKINTTLYEVTAYIKLEDISDGNVPTGEVTLISPVLKSEREI